MLRSGLSAPRGRLVLLFLNGLLWGLYDLHERPDEHFCSAYFGGNDDAYDVLKHSSNTVVSGDATAFHRAAAHNVPEPELRSLLNATDLAIYWLVNVYVGNTDWDHHNWYTCRNRDGTGGGFHWLSWDAEHVLGDSGGSNPSLHVDVTSKQTYGGPTGLLSRLLTASTEVQELMQCLIPWLFATDGPLGEAALQEVLARRVAEVREAVVAESARWGDSATFDGENGGLGWYGEDDFEREVGWLRDTFFPQRGSIVQEQLRRWWSHNRFGGSVMPEPTTERCLEVFEVECVGGCSSAASTNRSSDGPATVVAAATAGCEADVDHDGRVDVADLLLVLGAFGLHAERAADGACGANAGDGLLEDINEDCAVGVADLLLVLAAFGAVC